MTSNDLVHYLKSVAVGINMNDEKIYCLLYADDLVFLAESEEGLQRLLDAVSTWYNTWGVKVNSNKSKVVHFRGTHIPVSDFIFRCGQEVLETVRDYKYLCLLINEFLNFTYTSQAVAKSANRALGLIICKAKAYGGMPYSCFTKLYNALVLPIITYGSATWGDKSYSHIDALHNTSMSFLSGCGEIHP